MEEKEEIKRCCVVGAGTWGSALAQLLAKKGMDVSVCAATAETEEKLRASRNIPNLPGFEYEPSITLDKSMSETLPSANVVIFAVASPYTRKIAGKISGYVKPGTHVVIVSKGFEEGSLKSLETVVKEEIPQANVAILSGPTHAEEVIRQMPTICVVGAEKRSVAQELQAIFMTDNFRVYINSDMTGLAIGGAVKNVIALAAGTADGLGYGDNTKAALMTRGIAEITRLGKAMGADERTFSGLSGLGDLIATCESMHSRNRKAGYLIGKGETVEQAMNEVGMVVEGVYAARTILGLSHKNNVEMPIVREVNEVLFAGKDPAVAIKELMARDNIFEIPGQEWKA